MIMESTSGGNFKVSIGPRELVRLRADGTTWIAPDIRNEELRKVFPEIVQMAANLSGRVLECTEKHGSY